MLTFFFPSSPSSSGTTTKNETSPSTSTRPTWRRSPARSRPPVARPYVPASHSSFHCLLAPPPPPTINLLTHPGKNKTDPRHPPRPPRLCQRRGAQPNPQPRRPARLHALRRGQHVDVVGRLEQGQFGLCRGASFLFFPLSPPSPPFSVLVFANSCSRRLS